MIWQIEQSVVSRVLGFSYGTKVSPIYNPILPHHTGRKKSMSCSGMLRVAGGWSEIVKRVRLNLRFVVLLAKEGLGYVYEERRSEERDLLF